LGFQRSTPGRPVVSQADENVLLTVVFPNAEVTPRMTKTSASRMIWGFMPQGHINCPGRRLRLLAPEDVKGWSTEKLQYAINEMYARHGAAFPNQKIQRSFASFSWYRPQPDKSAAEIEELFTEVERANLQVLGAVRDSKKTGN